MLTAGVVRRVIARLSKDYVCLPNKPKRKVSHVGTPCLGSVFLWNFLVILALLKTLQNHENRHLFYLI